MKILVFGNGGSGKSSIATVISSVRNIPLLSLDRIYWRDARHRKARPHQKVARDVREFTAAESWIVEGTYTHLLTLADQSATHALWLDLPVHECMENIGRREDSPNPHLLARINEYYSRTNGTCWESHRILFAGFKGQTHRISSREAVTKYISELQAS